MRMSSISTAYTGISQYRKRDHGGNRMLMKVPTNEEMISLIGNLLGYTES